MTAGDASANRLIDARTGAVTTWAELAPVTIPAPAAVVVDSSFDALSWVREHARTGDELLLVVPAEAEDEVEQLAREQVLGPDLDDACAGCCRSGRRPDGGRPVARGDEVEAPVDHVSRTPLPTSVGVTASRASRKP